MKELAVGYCRVSTKKQEKRGLSLDAQEDYIRNNIDGKFDVIKFFKVQESGGDSERKHLMETFGYCVENNIKHILITDSDRWTRDREMDINAQKFIKENDLSVHIL
ncbi:recombinase family protein, partial [bacterium]|nr:recombinase family protein [bacterium]